MAIIELGFKNWDKELRKWLGGRVNSLAVDSGGKEDINRNLGAGFPL
jgi:hypothetical protein